MPVRVSKIAWAGLVAACCACAQPHFEVASVRVNQAAECRGRWDFVAENGSVTAENAPLLRIISRAYELTDDRVSGPAWLESECYDIRAKASSPVTQRDLMGMLRTLLEERLHLVAHRESNERPVFALLPDRGGVKISEDGDGYPVPEVRDGRVLFMARTLYDLCERLGKVAGRPVIDKTGLTGKYVIVLTYSPLDSANSEDIFTAVREQLGLRLVSQRAPLDVLKVDSLDKVPTVN
jgi:uncharacterized protein (TIGR03435 family)